MIVALNAPPAPFVAEQHHFAPGVALIVVGFSSAEAHAALVAPARDALPPLFEFATELPYAALQQMLDESAPWGMHAYSKSLYLDDLTDEAIDVVAERLPGKTSPMSLLPIFPLGGAFADVGEDDTAFGGPRSARFAVQHGRGRAGPADPGGGPGVGPVAVGGAAPVRVERRAATSTSWPSTTTTASGPPTARRSTTGWPRIKARLRPGQRLPPQREHQAGLRWQP